MPILKWQALGVCSQDNDKMDAIVQCRGIFNKFQDLEIIENENWFTFTATGITMCSL